MIETFILIVITHVYSGSTITMQEFNSLDQCEKSKEMIIDISDIKKVGCIKK